VSFKAFTLDFQFLLVLAISPVAAPPFEDEKQPVDNGKCVDLEFASFF
jgi:hypothetical protein